MKFCKLEHTRKAYIDFHYTWVPKGALVKWKSHRDDWNVDLYTQAGERLGIVPRSAIRDIHPLEVLALQAGD